MNKKILLFILGVYLVSSGASFATFTYFSESALLRNIVSQDETKKTVEDLVEEETKLSALLAIDPSEPKDQVCPLNGKYFTKSEQQAWSQRRPLAVMIENAPDARPQSGLSDADVLFEIMAEGGVTRFMGIFYCQAQRYDTVLAPIRSARSYFVSYASGFNYPMYVHVGGANLPGPSNALGQLEDYGWTLQNDVNLGFTFGLPYYRKNQNRLDREVATEHQGQTSTELLWSLAKDKRKWTNIAPTRKIGKATVGGDDWKDGYKGWSFQDEVPKSGSVAKIAYEFWTGFSEYGVEWNYNAETNTYKRVMAGEPHLDHNNDKQIEASNVVVLLVKEKGPINEVKHMLYTTEGTGNALIFNNGEAIKASWSKPTRESELSFTDRKGDPIELARGMVWISVVDVSTEVAY